MKTNWPKDKEIIVVTGPESTGKTTLVNRINEMYGIPTVPEFARTYLENKSDTQYQFSDLEIIGKCQNIQEAEAHQSYPLIICDTDIITVDIWAMEVFAKPICLPIQFPEKKHYLLCKPDIPWEPDPLRENPSDRERLFEVYHKYLQINDLTFEVLDEEGRAHYKILTIE